MENRNALQPHKKNLLLNLCFSIQAASKTQLLKMSSYASMITILPWLILVLAFIFVGVRLRCNLSKGATGVETDHKLKIEHNFYS